MQGKQCFTSSKLGDKTLLRKLQKLIALVGRYRFATQLLIGLQDLKNKENPNLKKLCFLCIVFFSIKLNHTIDPSILGEMVIIIIIPLFNSIG